MSPRRSVSQGSARRRKPSRSRTARPARPERIPEVPPPFQITRKLEPGNYPLSTVFPGFVDAPPFSKYPGPAGQVRALAEGTTVQVIPDDTWMYVAPRIPPPFAEAVGWKPFTSQTNCIVVGRKHLATSPAMTLYLDIYHEFFHILQREAGRELWDISHGYVDSPTELEAYGFSVAEARRLRVSDRFLRKYLEVDWISRSEHQQLMRNLGVPASDGNRPPRTRRET